MLRITHELKTILIKREKWATADLLKGFALAIAFHGALFFIFRIESFFDPNQHPILAPVSVEVDLNSSICQKNAQEPIFICPVENEEMPALLDFPEIDLSFEKKFPDVMRKDFDFSELEKIEYRSSIWFEDYDSN